MAGYFEENRTWRRQTGLVRGGLMRSQYDETSEAIYPTSGYVYGSAEEAEDAFANRNERFIYSRYGNPTVEMFQERLRLAENAPACFATASGMSAVFAAIVSMVKAGDHVVGARAVFGSCLYILTDILPRLGVETTIVDGPGLAGWKKALSRPTRCVFIESPSNPGLDIFDITAISDLAHEVGALVIIDNVFATPILQRPLELGADIVVYSATKHIDGQGRTLGGAILGSTEYCTDVVKPFLRHTGPSLSPFNAWVLLKGLETLELRVRQHCRNAREIATFLEGQNGILRVLYPGLESHPQHALANKQMSDFGSVVTIELAGGKETAFRFVNALSLIDISNNLGDTKSLVTHPATTTHQRLSPGERASLGLSDGVVRLSIGLEDADDIIEDIAAALHAAAA